MWSELEALAEARGREARNNGADTAAALLALYGALTHCQLAFDRVAPGAGPRLPGHADAVAAMDALLATLHNLQPTLHLFSPGLATELRAHVLGGPAPPDARPADRLRQQVMLLRQLLALQSEPGSDAGTLADFTGARRRLGAFLRYTFPPDQLLAG